jgi:hypothetical protein
MDLSAHDISSYHHLRFGSLSSCSSWVFDHLCQFLLGSWPGHWYWGYQVYAATTRSVGISSTEIFLSIFRRYG